MPQTTVSHNGKDIPFFVHSRKKDKVSKYIAKEHRFWERDRMDMYAEKIPVGSLVVDCGANIGCDTVFLGLNGYRVISFEPLMSNYKLLVKNISVNEIEAEARRIVLSDKCRKYKHVEKRGNLGATYFLPSKHGRFESSTLDKELKNAEVGAMKIDVEGAEVEAIKGARKTISKYHPKIFIEIHPFRNKNVRRDVMSVLEEFGYVEGEDLFVTGE